MMDKLQKVKDAPDIWYGNNFRNIFKKMNSDWMTSWPNIDWLEVNWTRQDTGKK